MTLVEQRKARCLGCQYLCEQGCLRGNYLPFATREEHLKYYGGDGGMTVRLTKDGIAVYLVDIKWCDFWKMEQRYECQAGCFFHLSEIIKSNMPAQYGRLTIISPITEICETCKFCNTENDFMTQIGDPNESTFEETIKRCDLNLVDVVVFDREKNKSI